MIRRTFLILMLIAVAAVILFARSERSGELPGMSGPAEPVQPGYFMTDARIVQTGADGQPIYRMRADRIQQNPADFTIRLRHLQLNYRVTAPKAPAREWTLTARQGDMPQTATSIELSGNVEILGLPGVGNSPPARIRTQKLSVDMQSNRVYTDEKVEFLWERRRLVATGLDADLKAQTVKLKSDLNGRFIR